MSRTSTSERFLQLKRHAVQQRAQQMRALVLRTTNSSALLVRVWSADTDRRQERPGFSRTFQDRDCPGFS